jgi:serine/threonine protein kinase
MLSPPPVAIPSMSAPDILSPNDSAVQQKPQPTIGGAPDSNIPPDSRQVDYAMESIDYQSAEEPPPLSINGDSYYEKDSQQSASDIDELQLQEELEAKWILNLSMHFRDMSDREKFFITYAEEPTRWRRVTVSCDYRELTPDSLEADLKSLHYQRDKSARIYEAIRDSLPDIQFYDTVTNLKLQTSDGRLHVHVTEDVNEIIPYPSLPALEHLSCKKFKESAISFDSHISGFVYKVSIYDKVYIKKEIPGPDAVEEFLYEINALCSLQDSKSVIKFEGIIVDENSELIKGLLISYADQGALVDLIYDYKFSDLMPWERRERWARQIVEGLSEIHEAGFVQGDFTLSNIVIDQHDNAKIIDINRRGCPVGWEPPELARLIESGQRISIYIGVKSDLFQLGMVLWALAEQHDEPERQERPLARTLERNHTLPKYLCDVIEACLSESPRGRPSAKEVLSKFPSETLQQPKAVSGSRQSASTHRSDKEYIDPKTAVDLDDITKHRQHSRSSFSNIQMPSTSYVGSSGSYILPNAGRGRSPAPSSRHRRSDYSPFAGPRSIMSLDDSELENELASLPASRETRWEQVYVDGDTKLVQRGGHGIEERDFATQELKDVCITTPPSELDSSFVGSKTSDETPLNLSTIAELQPPPSDQVPTTADLGMDMGHRRQPSNKASFSDRVHHLNYAEDSKMTNTLTNLENEISLEASLTSSAAPSRVGTGFSGIFSAPLHQDSGFSEPDRRSYESERIRQSLEVNKADIRQAQEERTVEERLWDEKVGTVIGGGVKGEQLVVRSVIESRVPAEVADEKPLEEKVSNTTIRPPSLAIPEFHHGVPEALSIDEKLGIAEKPRLEI